MRLIPEGTQVPSMEELLESNVAPSRAIPYLYLPQNHSMSLTRCGRSQMKLQLFVFNLNANRSQISFRVACRSKNSSLLSPPFLSNEVQCNLLQGFHYQGFQGFQVRFFNYHKAATKRSKLEDFNGNDGTNIECLSFSKQCMNLIPFSLKRFLGGVLSFAFDIRMRPACWSQSRWSVVCSCCRSRNFSKFAPGQAVAH